MVQGAGQRRWQVGDICNDDSPRLAGTPLRILDNFAAKHEWVLDPGDMLYLPAQYAHHGVALNDCLTYSIGFRAPAFAQIIDELATEAISHCKDHQRYRDSQLHENMVRGEIPANAIAQLKQIITDTLLDDSALQTWFGRYMTARKYPNLDLDSGSGKRLDWEKRLLSGGELNRHPASRLAFSGNDPAQLFIDGEVAEVERAFAELLCGNKTLNQQNLANFIDDITNRNLLSQLVEYGALFISNDDSI